jgi:hypothetical protein
MERAEWMVLASAVLGFRRDPVMNLMLENGQEPDARKRASAMSVRMLIE